MDSKVNLFWYGSEDEGSNERLGSEKLGVPKGIGSSDSEEEKGYEYNESAEDENGGVEEESCKEESLKKENNENRTIGEDSVQIGNEKKVVSKVTPSPILSNNKDNNDALNWIAVFDNNTNRYYYWNQV